MSRPSSSGAPLARSPSRAAHSRSPQRPPQPLTGFRVPGSSHPPPQPTVRRGPAPPQPASLLQPRLPCNYHGAPTSGRSRRTRPPAGLRWREAGNSARPRPRPGLPRPGRAPGSAPHAGPRVQVPTRLSPKGTPTRAEQSADAAPPPKHPPSSLASPGAAAGAATPARARRPPSAARAAPGSPQPRPRLQILPRRLCSTRTSRLSSSPVSGSAVPVTAGASGEAAAAGAAAAMVPPGPYRSPTACVARQGGAGARPRPDRASL